MQRIGLGCALGLVSLPLSLSATPAHVTLEQSGDGDWQLRRNGEAFVIRGAGGFSHLEFFQSAGGTTVRTWGAEHLQPDASGETLLDRAAKLGLCVMVGLWVDHPRHGADYGDEVFLREQRERILSLVRQHKDHPAVLLWGLGNEMEEDGSDPRVWQELERLAQLVKAEDPRHPICTVIAGTYNNKVAAMREHYHSLDLLGVNIYGGAENVDAALAEQGWDRPYLITEFGPVGHWEIEAAPWGAPLEPTPAEKVEFYQNHHRAVMNAPRRLCLGTFAFLWGQKQETTATWFSMFLESGEKTPVVDVMVREWTGQEPVHPSPVIHALKSDLHIARVRGGDDYTVTANVTAADGDELDYQWLIREETSDRKFGGDPEAAPPAVQGAVVASDGATATLRVPRQTGAYRVFLYVRNQHGGGSAANFPFYVE